MEKHRWRLCFNINCFVFNLGFQQQETNVASWEARVASQGTEVLSYRPDSVSVCIVGLMYNLQYSVGQVSVCWKGGCWLKNPGLTYTRSLMGEIAAFVMTSANSFFSDKTINRWLLHLHMQAIHSVRQQRNHTLFIKSRGCSNWCGGLPRIHTHCIGGMITRSFTNIVRCKLHAP